MLASPMYKTEWSIINSLMQESKLLEKSKEKEMN